MQKSNVNLQRRGAAAMLVILCSVALMVFGIVVMNICWISDCRERLQTTADSAAITAARVLMATNDTNKSKEFAKSNASEYRILQKETKLQISDIQFGNRSRNPNGSYEFILGQSPFNSVRVSAQRAKSGQGGVPIFMGAIVGRGTIDLESDAIATFADHDIAVVIDASGMMHGPGRFSGVLVALDQLLDVVNESGISTRLSVTVFSKGAETILPLTKSLGAVRSAIDSIQLRGPRELGEGMHRGLESLFENGTVKSDSKKSLIVLSEFKSPKGANPIQIARIAQTNDVEVDVFTFTKIAGTALADQVAAAGGGEHNHAASQSELKNQFQKIVSDVPVFLFD